MSNHDSEPLRGQAGLASGRRTRRRGRRRRRPRHTGAALYRPGRFFKKNKKLEHYRFHLNPRHLGEADWMLYRRKFNPYHPRRRAHDAYEAGYRIAKREIPRPDWPAITW